MTNGDRIRSMTDEELARFINALVSRGRNQTMSKMVQSGAVPNMNIVEVPMLAIAEHLRWLRKPIEEE